MFNSAFFEKASLVASEATCAAPANIDVSELKSFKAALTTFIWKTPPANSLI